MFSGVIENIGYLRAMPEVTIEHTKKSLVYYTLSKLGYDISSSKDIVAFCSKHVSPNMTSKDDMVYGGSIILQKGNCAFVLVHVAPLGLISSFEGISNDAFQNLFYGFNDLNTRKGTSVYGGGVYTDGRYWMIYPCKKRRLDSSAFISVDLENLTPFGQELLHMISYNSIGDKLYDKVIEFLLNILSDILVCGINDDLSTYIRENYGVLISDSLWYDAFLLMVRKGLNNVIPQTEIVLDEDKSVDSVVGTSVGNDSDTFSVNSIVFGEKYNHSLLPKDIARKGKNPVKFGVKLNDGYGYVKEVSSWRGLFLACTDYLLDTIGIDGILSKFGADFGGYYRRTREEFSQKYSESGFNGDKFPNYRGIFFYGPLAGTRIVDFLKRVSSSLGVEFIIDCLEKDFEDNE